MKIRLGVTAAFMLIATSSLAQTPTAPIPAQCNFTAAPTIPDGATASNDAMRAAREALEAWRNVRASELAACNTAAQTLQAQAAAAAAAHNTAATDTDATIRRFVAENEEYNARGATARRERGGTLTRTDH